MWFSVLKKCLSAVLVTTLIAGPAAAQGNCGGPVPKVKGSKTHLGEFVHPGLWHTHDDLERMRLGVKNKEEPYASAFANFSKSPFAQADYKMAGPLPIVCRGCGTNETILTNDTLAAYQNALMWYITRDQGHWTRATTILDAWGTTITGIGGRDEPLLLGLQLDILVNAAEIMRWEGGWVEQGARPLGSSGFSAKIQMFKDRGKFIGQANYGMVSIKGLLSYAVYLDDVSAWNYAMWHYLEDPCAGLYGNFNRKTGQGAETGRDQDHAIGALGWAAEAARTIQSQGTDVYEEADELIARAAEYTAKYNLGHDVEYDRKYYRCTAQLVNGPWAGPSNIHRASEAGFLNVPKSWDIVYYQYVVKRGFEMPYTTEMKKRLDAIGGEGRVSKNPHDHPGWGDLIWSYPGRGDFSNNNTQTIWGGGLLGVNGLGNWNNATS